LTSPDFTGLFDPNPGPPSDFYIAFVVLFAVLFVGGIAVALMRRQLFPSGGLPARLARRFGWYATVLGALGLGLLIARYAALPGLSMRVLLLVALAAIPALGGYVAVFAQVRYPKLAAAQHAEQLQRRYSTPAKGGGSAIRRSKKRRRGR
jgi:hypothetical protein